MKTILCVAGLLCCLSGLSAQMLYPGLSFKAGDTTVAYRGFVKFYQKPDQHSLGLGSVKKGEEVIIRQKTTVVAEFDGALHYWYQVSFGKHFQYTGYVLGAHLASACVKTPEGEKFLLHYIANGTKDSDPVLLEIKAVQNDEDESSSSISIEFILNAGDTLITKVYNNRGFSGAKRIIVFDFQDKACPNHHRELAIVWNGESIPLLPFLLPKGHACATNAYIFPADTGGIPGIIQVKTQLAAAPEKIVRLRKLPYNQFIPEEK